MKVIAPPSVVDDEAIAKTGAASSLLSVPVAEPVTPLIIAPPVAALKDAVKVSLLSNNVSWVVWTEKVFEASP